MDAETHILLISGSLRAGSTNSALLRTAVAIAPAGIEATIYPAMGELPHFNPDDDRQGEQPAAAVEHLRSRIATSDAILFCTPEYAGGLPGSFKNLLDWTVGGGETYGLAVAWVNVAGPAAPAGGANAIDSLRKVLGFTGAVIVEEACAAIPLERGDVGADGTVADPEVRSALIASLQALADAARTRRAASA